MTVTETLHDDGVLEVVIEHPPVNAFTIGDLRTLAETFNGIERRPEVRAALLRSEGRGFCGGGDLKEVQSLEGFAGILGQANGSYTASLALAECAVPVVAAVHQYCIGVGVLLAGAVDIVVSHADARFVLAEVDNGATGGAIQAVGLMPERRLRAAMFTCEPVLAAELAQYGGVYRSWTTTRWHPSRSTWPESSPPSRHASSAPRRVRSIDPSAADIRRQYRIELSYTYELNLLGEAAAARQGFLDGDRGGYTAAP